MENHSAGQVRCREWEQRSNERGDGDEHMCLSLVKIILPYLERQPRRMFASEIYEYNAVPTIAARLTLSALLVHLARHVRHRMKYRRLMQIVIVAAHL